MKEAIKIKGVIRGFFLRKDVDENTEINGVKVLDIIRRAIKKKDLTLLEPLKEAGLLNKFTEKNNIIVTTGRAVLARLLAGDATYSGEINYGALGTDNTAPVNADTTLGTEVYRKLASSQAFEDNIAYIDFFYEAGDTDGTYEEFGNFIDGGAGADTGQLFSHIATGGWVKSAIESLFVSCEYTLS